MRNLLINLIAGIVLGFVFVRMGFTNFGEVHHFFMLNEIQMWLAVLTAIIVTAIAFSILQRGKQRTVQTHDRRLAAIGAVLIGLAWAITGVCPATVLAQLGTGYLPALVVIFGIVLGIKLYQSVLRSVIISPAESNKPETKTAEIEWR